MAHTLTTERLRAAARRAGRGERVVVPGAKVAVVPAEDLALLEEYEDAADVAAAEKALAEDEVLPWSEVRKKYART